MARLVCGKDIYLKHEWTNFHMIHKEKTLNPMPKQRFKVYELRIVQLLL